MRARSATPSSTSPSRSRGPRPPGRARLGPLLGYADRRAQRSLHARVTTYVAAAVVVLLGVSGAAMVEAERGSPDADITSLGDGVWWAATTISTVGYGDRYPITGLGRCLAVALMLVGIALLGIVSASVAALFVSRLEVVAEAEERTEATLADVLAELREVRTRLDALTPTGARPCA